MAACRAADRIDMPRPLANWLEKASPVAFTVFASLAGFAFLMRRPPRVAAASAGH